MEHNKDYCLLVPLQFKPGWRREMIKGYDVVVCASWGAVWAPRDPDPVFQTRPYGPAWPHPTGQCEERRWGFDAGDTRADKWGTPFSR